MATVITTIEVGDPNGQNFQELELEVHTGSTDTALPREMLQALGVPVNRSVQARLADGTLQTLARIHRRTALLSQKNSLFCDNKRVVTENV